MTMRAQETTSPPADRVARVPERWQPPGRTGAATRLAAALALAMSAEHWGEMPDHFDKATYVGWLFVVGAVATLYTAFALVRRPSLVAWWVGAGASGLMIIGGILSRTTGLPSASFSKWGAPLIVSLVLEAGFLILWAVTRLGTQTRG